VTMLEDIGRPVDVHEIDHDLMRQAIEMIAKFEPQRRREGRFKAIERVSKNKDSRLP
jgi:hypothetical protein